MNEVVRVATNNNFNCTQNEWDQLDQFANTNSTKDFFINSNINTPNLTSINEHTYKSVITLNPNLIVTTESLQKLSSINKDSIAFVRIKYLPDAPEIINLIHEVIKMGIPIVITIQRFNSKASLEKYSKLEYFKHSCSRYRLAGPELDKITNLVSDLQAANHSIHICDQAGTGCQGCGLCSRLTTGKPDSRISSLNLSSSGLCPYNCPDCYAKTMQKFCTAMGNKPIEFDVIKRNSKQAGTTKHIKEAKHAA